MFLTVWLERSFVLTPPLPPSLAQSHAKQQGHRGKYLRNIFLPGPVDSYLPGRSKGERLKERS